MTRTLLFGDDGSSGADIGWLWINGHDWPGWDVEVLCAGVHDAPPPAREWLRPAPPEGLRTVTESGDPRLELARRGASCDLVVVGARGKGVLKKLHLGSTSEWLMHGPPAPLVITRSGRPTRKVLMAHDGSVHGEATEAALASLPWLADTQIRVVTLLEREDSRQQAEAARAHLAQWAGSVDLQVLRPSELEVFYRPRDLILDLAADWKPDLLALGSRGLSGWESVSEVGLHRAGSTASGVAQAAQCNVLLAQAASAPGPKSRGR